MFLIGLIREGKIPADNRVALVPQQCKWLQDNVPGVKVVAQPCKKRCFSDEEYLAEGIEIREDLSDCDLLLGIKEVPIENLIPGKRYMYFSILKRNSYITRS